MVDVPVLEPRASFEELREFCNRVRMAGGAEELDELQPARPKDPGACLIAKGLNFSCTIGGVGAYDDGEHMWGMCLGQKETAATISEELGLPQVEKNGNCILLPREIGRVAAAYDIWWNGAHAGPTEEGYQTLAEIQASEFWPYVEKEYQETLIDFKKRMQLREARG